MFQKIKSYLLSVSTLLAVALPMAAPALVVSADCSNIGNQVSVGAAGASGSSAGTGLCSDSSNVSQDSITAIAKKVVDIFSVVIGAVAVIMIIYGGFRYITSGGDSGRVGNAKNTLVYAIVGLVIVALAQVIVHFVLNTSSSAVTQ